MTDTTRVLIADDHGVMRAGLRVALERGGYIVCAEAANAPDAIAAAIRERPDVCLLDIRMPGNGIRAAAEITAQLPGTYVVMLTVSDETDDLIDAVRAGATGYLLKHTVSAQLLDAVRDAAAGEAPLSGMLTARLLEEFRRFGPRTTLPTPGGRAVHLTRREWDVVELMASDLSTAQIAKRLFIEPVTVRRHIAEAMRKSKASSRGELGHLVRSRTTRSSQLRTDDG